MIKVIQGDITTLSVDAIVNAANEMMLGGGGVEVRLIHAKVPGPNWRGDFCRNCDRRDFCGDPIV